MNYAYFVYSSLAAPIGLGLGMGVMEVTDELSSEILSGVLQGTNDCHLVSLL